MTVRIDKWLWAARFYKHRATAVQAVTGGKVHVNGERVKPSYLVKVGDMLTITQGHYKKVVQVNALSDKRGPATEAEKRYEETQASLEARTLEMTQRKLLKDALPHTDKKPDKHTRKLLRDRKKTSYL